MSVELIHYTMYCPVKLISTPPYTVASTASIKLYQLSPFCFIFTKFYQLSSFCFIFTKFYQLSSFFHFL